MWLVHLKEVVYLAYIWRRNLAHRKYSFDLFCTKWDLRVLTSSAKSMNRELSFVVRAQFWRGSTKEFAILVNRIFPTLLAAWSRQQYPCTCRWVKRSFIVLISKWWQIGRTFPGLLRSIYSLSWWSPIAPFTWGAIRYNNTQSYNICIKAFLITSVYGIVKFFYSLLPDFYVRRKLVIYAVLG